ncbi:E3 ubiquitin-protein ligase listerin [Hypsizygus marmoreus]|uniref:E3 ubiquitin-protein ligase listerin n=1 Tax=Hypsizygus marmoreus TaxID=39966 RepID=A0A369JH17_HYPMA|nr:E3 ubiquitin-protein ligase listerin [Hypsizygus marmoreus]
MAKGSGKSSATSATRKKHAKKTAGPSVDEQPIPKEKKLTKQQRGQKKKEPRVKVYIPPVKPAPVQPDPLETTGLAHSLPPELLIVLRSFGKKAQVTKIRALEELQSAWVDRCRKEGEDGQLVYVLVEMLPVWLHHVSALFVHPSRRVRLLAAGVHTSLLQISPIRDQILFFLRETASSSQIESILGTWCMVAHDIDRAVSATALKSWTTTVSLDPTQDQTRHLLLDDRFLQSFIPFIQRAILDPNGIYLYLNPPAPVAPPPPGKKGAVRKEDPELAARSKAEELEEDEQDRKARLRVGGLGAIRRILEISHQESSDNMIDFFKNPALWSSLYHAEHCPFVEIVESFGYAQPSVRKGAWGLLQTLLESWKDHLEPLLPVLASATLRSAWVEPDTAVHATMWQPLLRFLKEFPQCWELEYSQELAEGSDSEESDSEDNDRRPAKVASMPSIAYQEFLQFLESGCSGSPLQGYPTVIIIISTIPSSIISSTKAPRPLNELFDAFWKVLDGRALSSLQRSATSAAFMGAMFECMVLLIKRARNDSGALLLGSSGDGADAVVRELAIDQVRKAWTLLEAKSLKVEGRAAARLMAQTLGSLNAIDANLFAATWETLAKLLLGATGSEQTLISVFLKVFQDKFKHVPGPRDAAAVLMADILHLSTKKCVEFVKDEGITPVIEDGDGGCVLLLISMFDQFRDSLFDDVEFSKLMDEMTTQYAIQLLAVSPSLLLAYLTHRKDQYHCLGVWRTLLSSIARHPAKAEHSITPLLDAAQKGTLPHYLKPDTGDADTLVENLLAKALVGDVAYLALARQVLQSPDYFLSGDGYTASLQTVILAFIANVDLALSDPEVSMGSLEPSLDLITSLIHHPPRELPRGEFDILLPDMFICAFLLPTCYLSESSHPAFCSAKGIWEHWLQSSEEESRTPIFVEIKGKLKLLLCNTQVRPSARDILGLLPQTSPGLHFDLPGDIFPTPHEIDELLCQLSPDPIHPSLAVLDPLVPPASAFSNTRRSPQSHDSRGFSTYARVVDALLQVFIGDRQVARRNIWALRHFHALEIYAQDFINVPSAQSDVFTIEALHAGLEEFVVRVEQITTYILTSSSDEGWCTAALAAALGEKSALQASTRSTFLVDIIRYARESDNARDIRILKNVLEHVFHDVDKNEADRWMLLGRKVEATAPQTSMAIVFTVANYAPEPPRLDRYRNELAAGLLGIPPLKANTEGLLTLRKLAVSAPNPDSDIVFLPQPRAVNIAKACQQWISSDEDIDEEVESEMTLVFFHLAPILQDVPGAHWDLIFDVLENNLENSSMADDATLVALARTLRLVILIQDLVSTNKSLRADWQERKMTLLTMIRDLATISLDEVGFSAPRSICRGLVLSIIQDLPSSLIDQDSLPKMAHLIIDTSVDVQKMAYQFLKSAAKKRTEYHVIEAGVDSEDSVNAELPIELLQILPHTVSVDGSNADVASQNIFGYLLAWMLLFDLFQDASLKVRTSYIEQLRNLGVVETYFLPNVISLLRLDQGPLKAYKLDIWAVDEFYVEFYNRTFDFSLTLLAAHLYYRALLTIPSLIHTWVLDCKDRQLSSSITNYTAQYFSPVIIRTELAHVKSPESTALLVDDNFTIKVASSVNEVVASYLVDEHQLEMKLKIPSDWPLHKIEVKDMKRVGVDENRWRAWILAVQQIIWSHNGSIVDGLGLFKKNVTLHFEGQVECPICYSIISVMDGSLPKKPCRTCKNRFHAGCLYKWFNSSHSSSCPLCRSDIF